MAEFRKRFSSNQSKSARPAFPNKDGRQGGSSSSSSSNGPRRGSFHDASGGSRPQKSYDSFYSADGGLGSDSNARPSYGRRPDSGSSSSSSSNSRPGYGDRRPQSGGYRGGSAGGGSYRGGSSASSSGRSFGGGGRSFSGGGRSFPSSAGSYRGGGRPQSRFGGQRGAPRRNFAQSNINPNNFIKVAKPVTETVVIPITHKFTDFGLSKPLVDNLLAKNYVDPTPIQDQAIPLIMKGIDVVGIANTGTGKTAAFLLPLLDKIYHDYNQRVLIVAPTRELAIQIQDDLNSFAHGMRITAVQVVGGQSMYQQKANLRRPHNFVIGTPGRLLDLIQQRALQLRDFQHIVLDEVDRMLDMGFIQDITNIIKELAPQRQSLFFSATMNDKITRIMKAFVHDYQLVSVKTAETSDQVNQNIVEVFSREEKFAKLKETLEKFGDDKVLVFVRTKIGADKIQFKLKQNGINAMAIHGNKAQNQRLRALSDFKTNKVRVLIATDVAARGLDIPNVGHVINYDVPATQEDYVHRIGRTGRAGKAGNALTFIEKFTRESFSR